MTKKKRNCNSVKIKPKTTLSEHSYNITHRDLEHGITEKIFLPRLIQNHPNSWFWLPCTVLQPLFRVKLATDEQGKLFAIKRYRKETANLATLQHELAIMKQLKHENLVQLYAVRENATYKRKDETTFHCFAIILEYVDGGELFDFIAETGKFSEKVSRTYFHQMMNGLYHMHSRGIAHRDIKP